MNAENGNKLKYMEIYNHFKGLIVSKVLVVGDKIPTESEIGEAFNVSRITVTKALNMLSNDSFIYRIPGSGTYVKEAEPSKDDNSLNLISLIASFKPQGREIELIQGIENYLKQNGFLLSVSNSNDDLDLEKELIYSVKDKVRGIILYPCLSTKNTDVFYELFKENYPVIYVDKYPFNVPCNYVVSDNFNGGYSIGKYFIEKNHKRMALIFHDLAAQTSELDRFNGFMKAVGEKGINRDDIKIISLGKNISSESKIELYRQLLKDKNTGDDLTAIFACNDVLAYDLMKHIAQENYNLPDNFILAGFDDLNTVSPNLPFITVHQELYDIGEAAAKLILKIVDNNMYVNEHQIIPVRLVEKL
ncbi:MAG TPA: GntR family transcriptional regulator [Clostridiales bacterium]|nr:GntR family transcriptional regulator [Clostridiales bacterium]